MIEATELRIGNLIHHITYESNCKVDLVKLNLIIHQPDSFKAIELTEEWLPRLGFELVDCPRSGLWEFNRLLNGRSLFYVSAGNYLEYSDSIIREIHSVHDFQNWYYWNSGKNELQFTN